MLLHDARRAAGLDTASDLVLLEEQDRTLWDRVQISEARAIIARALTARRLGPYLLQAAIADLHAEAPSTERTDWPQIVALYEVLLRLDPSPVVALNRAVALAMRDGARAGLEAIDTLLVDPQLQNYHLAHAARADLLRRLEQWAMAAQSYTSALELTRQPAEQRFLRKRLAELSAHLEPRAFEAHQPELTSSRNNTD